ncbi:hypothetical protein DS834_06690 [Lactobacillus bombicola]|uniref:Replication initiation protein-like C-terminal domain-containing protein n=1 Tax=Lactobacillus bombicola TaxID=1505723 RepID=A0ABX9LTE8_9LACO|nr:replication initiation factor domain-containing protein [Lactobacillus bombicola]RHW50331.1 hypothetical protein DS834_06690 [Lactobacillus bombicola]
MKLNNIKIDQIRLMVPVRDQKLKTNEFPFELKAINSLFNFDTLFSEKTVMRFGRNGYTLSVSYGSENQGELVTIMFNPNRLDMGLLIDFTASGKALFESLCKLQDIKVNWKKIIELIYQKFRGHISRIDIAIDLIDYNFSINEIFAKLKCEEYIFLNARNQAITEDRIKYIGTKKEVLTIYVGSRRSDAFLRLYNKKQEQSDNKGLYRLVADKHDNWVRFEGEFKHREAHAIGAMISTLNTNNIYPYLAGCILKHWKMVINVGSQE